MGLTYASIDLRNPVTGAALAATCLVDTGALHLRLPEHLALQLGFDLSSADRREVTLADGSRKLVPYVGPLLASFATRRCFLGALVLGDEPLLGAIPMEDMDLVVLPAERILAVNPRNPNVAVSVAKSSHSAPRGA